MQTPPAPAVSSSPAPSRKRRSGFTGLQVLGFVLVAMIVSAGATYFVARHYLWPRDFEPVVLSQSEQVELDAKLRALGVEPPPPPVSAAPGGTASGAEARESHEEWLRAEPYREDPSKREIGITERELNALLAHNTELARKLAIDLSDNLASARLLIPVDPDFPFFGGRTLRVAAGLELSYGEGRPVVIIRGLSLMGVPVPNAWLGNLKNVDLVEHFGGGPGVWKAFADGVEFAQIREGELKVKLKK